MDDSLEDLKNVQLLSEQLAVVTKDTTAVVTKDTNAVVTKDTNV